jgi:hypothetical protein
MKKILIRRWSFLFVILLILLLISYLMYMRSTGIFEKRNFVLAYGILGFASVLFLLLYIVRKRVYRFHIGSTYSWLQAHSYIGILSLVIICMHSRFSITGTYSIFLVIFFLVVVISGIVGSLIYSIIPLQLTKYGREVKTNEDIIKDMKNCLKVADRMVENTSGEFKSVYKKKIRPFIRSKRTRWEYWILKENELLSKRRDMIEKYKNVNTGQDMYELDMLSSLLAEKEKLSFMLAKIKLQSIWLSFHLPLTTALLMAILIHVWSILYF